MEISYMSVASGAEQFVPPYSYIAIFVACMSGILRLFRSVVWSEAKVARFSHLAREIYMRSLFPDSHSLAFNHLIYCQFS
jgi:hypothetical protein